MSRNFFESEQRVGLAPPLIIAKAFWWAEAHTTEFKFTETIKTAKAYKILAVVQSPEYYLLTARAFIDEITEEKENQCLFSIRHYAERAIKSKLRMV